jgi:hypothetical protein
MKWAEDKLDILQNLEFSVVEIWHDHPDLSDYNALRAYETAFQSYRSELRGQVPKLADLKGLDAVVYEALRGMCEFRLARGPCPLADGEKIPAIPLELLVDCLRGLAKSVERHTRDGGRQGYLSFAHQFLH